MLTKSSHFTMNLGSTYKLMRNLCENQPVFWPKKPQIQQLERFWSMCVMIRPWGPLRFVMKPIPEKWHLQYMFYQLEQQYCIGTP